jgi:hypothetical protein
MKALKRQDRNGVRTAVDLERRYKFNEIELTADEVEYLKQFIEVDSFLSTSSVHAVQNKVITNALNSKVSKETGKGLSTNDFTNTLLEKLNKIQANAEENLIESISVNGTTQTITNKNVDIQLEDIASEDIEANTKARHTHSNKTVLDGITADDISDWNEATIIDSNIADNEGYIWYENGKLEQWGRVSITPTAANTVTSLKIIFPKAYDKVPDIDAIPQANTPNAITWSVGGGSTTDEAKQGMIIYATRTNTSATLFKWRAKGFKNP